MSQAAIVKFPGKRFPKSAVPSIQANNPGKTIAFVTVPRNPREFETKFCVWDLAIYRGGFKLRYCDSLGRFAWDHDERAMWQHVDDLNAVLGVTWDRLPGS
jgi:hypothetical protein